MINRISILQPSYIPWLGYFEQINKVDAFVFYDDVLYTKNDWRNRNKIKTPTGTVWLTIPVNIKNRLTDYLLIKDVTFADKNILKKHIKAIELNYKKAPFFKEFFPILTLLFNKRYIFLSDFNIIVIKAISNFLDIKKVNFLKSSDLSITNPNPTDRLIGICKNLKATHYLTGNSAKNYLDEKLFAKNGIILEYQEYKHPTYKQLWGDFIPYLSVIDLIFNEGHDSLKILSNKK